MQVLASGWLAEGIDGEIALRQPNAPRAAAEGFGEFLVATAQVEDDRDRVVLLDVRQNEIQEKGLAGPRRTLDEGMADIIMVQIPKVRRVMLRLEHGETVGAPEMRRGPGSRLQREQEAE